MPPPRYAAQKDRNHNEIERGLIARGYSVADTHALGNDFPDLVVSWPRNQIWPWGGCVLLEVKDGKKRPSKRKLSEGQADFRLHWRGPYIVALSIEDALAQIERMRRQLPDAPALG